MIEIEEKSLEECKELEEKGLVNELFRGKVPSEKIKHFFDYCINIAKDYRGEIIVGVPNNLKEDFVYYKKLSSFVDYFLNILPINPLNI